MRRPSEVLEKVKDGRDPHVEHDPSSLEDFMKEWEEIEKDADEVRGELSEPEQYDALADESHEAPDRYGAIEDSVDEMDKDQ